MTISTSPIILYHASCDDGFGAAYAAWMHLGDNAEYRPVQYGDTAPLEQLVERRRVYIVDFSFSPDVILANCASASSSQINKRNSRRTEAIDPTTIFIIDHIGNAERIFSGATAN